MSGLFGGGTVDKSAFKIAALRYEKPPLRHNAEISTRLIHWHRECAVGADGRPVWRTERGGGLQYVAGRNVEIQPIFTD